jgi:S1-C subfamily serine protease
MEGNKVLPTLPYLPIETRENVAFQDDSVLVAGYPAEFVGGIVAQQNLYAATSISSIKQLLTFSTGSVDVFSVGSVIEAQGGSSGGPIVNAWNHVVGIITTTSDGPTTAERELHAINLNYIERDVTSEAGAGLATVLSSDVQRLSDEFSRETSSILIQKYIEFLTSQ